MRLVLLLVATLFVWAISSVVLFGQNILKEMKQIIQINVIEKLMWVLLYLLKKVFDIYKNYFPIFFLFNIVRVSHQVYTKFSRFTYNIINGCVQFLSFCEWK